MTSITKCQLGVLGGMGVFFALGGAIFLGSWHSLFDFILYKVRKQVLEELHTCALSWTVKHSKIVA